MPTEPAPKGLRVAQDEPDSESYRTSGKSVVETTVSWRWWRLGWWRETSRAFVLLAVDAVLLLLFRYFVIEVQAWTPVVLMGLFVGLPVLGLHYSAIQFFANATTLVASNEGLRVSWGPIGSGERMLARANLRQLYIVAIKERAALAHVKSDGTPELIARNLDLPQARWLERTLEDALSLTDEEVLGEVPRDDARAAAVMKRSWIRPVVLILLSVVGMVLGGYYFVTLEPTRGVSLLEGPVEITLPASDETRSFWVVLRASSEEATEERHLRGLTRIVIDVGEQTLSCDPFDSSFHNWTSTDTGLSETTFAFVGRLDGCAVAASNALTVHARVEGHDNVRFHRLELFAR